VQHYTSYVAVGMKNAADREAARVFVRFLGGPTARALFEAAGIG
jgi:ABC-type molybdate transport system substrate-binding protein